MAKISFAQNAVDATGTKLPVTIYKKINTTVSSTIVTEVSIPEWQISVTAGKIYSVEIVSSYQTALTTTGGELGFFLSGGAAGSIIGSAEGYISTVSGTAPSNKGVINTISIADAAGSNIITTGVSAINTAHTFYANVIYTCTTSGTFNVGWASEVATSAAQINAGSTLLYQILN